MKEMQFKGQMEGEEVISFAHRHWLWLLPMTVPYLICLIILITALLMTDDFPSTSEPLFQMLLILGLSVSAFWTHRFFLNLINYFLTSIIVTNFRIVEVKKTVFMHHVMESIDMRKIQDIQMTQHGLIKNILKCGNIHVILGNTETRTITYVPHPAYFFRLINSLKGELIHPLP